MNVPASQSPSYAQRYQLKVSHYDRVASLLLALLILLSVVVLALLIIWWTSRIFLKQAAVPVEMVELGTGDDPLAGGMELEGPTDQEIGLETDLEEEEALEETLTSFADAGGARVAMLDDPSLSDRLRSGRGGGSRGDGRGVGTGSGPGGFGTARNWDLRLTKGKTLETYARQLDHFGIWLGVLRAGNKEYEYAFNLSKQKPDTKTGPAEKDTRYHFIWPKGKSQELQEADRKLLERAGIESKGRIILKFLPPEVEADLMRKEKAHAGREPSEIRKTRFGIRSTPSGYEFYVIEQLAKRRSTR